MKKKILALSLAGGMLGAGLISVESTYAATPTKINDLQKQEEINLIKNGNFDEGGKHWLRNGMFEAYVKDGYAVVNGGSGPLTVKEPFLVEPNTKYKLSFDIKSDHPFTSQPSLYLNTYYSNGGSASDFSRQITSSKDWKTFSFEYTTSSKADKLLFGIFEQRKSAFYIDNVKFVKIDGKK